MGYFILRELSIDTKWNLKYRGREIENLLFSEEGLLG